MFAQILQATFDPPPLTFLVELQLCYNIMIPSLQGIQDQYEHYLDQLLVKNL